MKHLILWGMIVVVVSITSRCTLKPSSREVFSKSMDIIIPEDVEVTQDEFHAMWQDFSISYDIALTEKQMTKLTQSIRKSTFYNPHKFFRKAVTQDMLIERNNIKAVWIKSEFGYVFQNADNHYTYSAKIDTIGGIATFYKAHD